MSEVLAVFIADIGDGPAALKERIEEADEQILVERRAEDTLEAEISQRVDISLPGIVFYMSLCEVVLYHSCSPFIIAKMAFPT